ncbi:hypothetical protein TWF696_005510 [Orbilia brochopaga]|uniref:Uncharacterized protein n=1 Tax=Orbilia brochopaga TaxID=3140254 RepID=A0AAV9V496_9PEZI
MEAPSAPPAQTDHSPVSETSTSGFHSINKPQQTPVGLQTPAPQIPIREYWSDADKYDLLWSVILSTGATLPTLDWSKIRIPPGHTQQSAVVIVQDIAYGKHHITHPTFTPSNTNTSCSTASLSIDRHPDSSTRKPKTPAASKTKKRKLQDDATNAQLATPSLSVSHASSSSPSPLSDDEAPAATTGEEKSKKPRRRKRSESPIELDLTNPRIRSFLQSEGYMAADGTPVKRKRGRPTKDPFGLSVTLKKQLQRLDPNAPPMKKRGRPRKPFPVDIQRVDADDIATDADGRVHLRAVADVDGGRDHGNISPSLRSAIEKIGEEMDREVEGMLNESRSLEHDDRENISDAEEEEEEEDSDGYEGDASGMWEAYEGEVKQKDGSIVASGADKENVPVVPEMEH